MTSTALATFLAGVGLSLTVAVPIGPMGVLCIQRTLACGLAAGLTTGLAAATVQVTYGLFAALGLSPTTIPQRNPWANVLLLLSAAILFWFAFRSVRREVVIGGNRSQPSCLAGTYCDALLFGFANPLTVVLFFAAFPALTAPDDLTRPTALIGGVLAGVMGWYVILSTTVALLRSQLPARALSLVNKVSGCALSGLGWLLLAQAFGLRSD